MGVATSCILIEKALTTFPQKSPQTFIRGRSLTAKFAPGAIPGRRWMEFH
jgi:hypothetical protein